jgi:hypothetical protein
VPPRRVRDPHTPRMALNAAILAMLRWVVILGGLVIIVDLGTHALLQRMSSNGEVLNELGNANTIANVVLFSILGAVVARQTGIFYLGAVAGLLASLVDGLVVATAGSMAPPPGGAPPIDQYLAFNIAIGTIPAAVSALVSNLVERMSGPRSR